MRTAAALLLAALTLLPSACRKKLKDVPLPKRRYAVLSTSMGDIKLELLAEAAPKTVANFVALTDGSKEWKDPATGKPQKRPLYSGIAIFRVVADQLIQTGDPTGKGGPEDEGFTIPDELGGKFDQPGLVGMANFGAGTANSQFFITLKAMPDLDGHHALFARVVDGLDVVRKISRLPANDKDGSDRPYHPAVLDAVRLSDR